MYACVYIYNYIHSIWMNIWKYWPQQKSLFHWMVCACRGGMRSQFSIESVQMHALTSMAFEETLGEATSLAYLAYLMVCLNGKSSPPKKYGNGWGVDPEPVQTFFVFQTVGRARDPALGPCSFCLSNVEIWETRGFANKVVDVPSGKLT